MRSSSTFARSRGTSHPFLFRVFLILLFLLWILRTLSHICLPTRLARRASAPEGLEGLLLVSAPKASIRCPTLRQVPWGLPRPCAGTLKPNYPGCDVRANASGLITLRLCFADLISSYGAARLPFKATASSRQTFVTSAARDNRRNRWFPALGTQIRQPADRSP